MGAVGLAGKLRLAVVAAVVAASFAIGASAAQATTWTVTDTGDGAGSCPGSTCTLRAAVNAAASGDTIALPSGTTTLNGSNGPVQVSTNLTIVGAGASATTLTASPASELIYLNSAQLTLMGLTLANAQAFASAQGYPGQGGAIYDNYGLLRIVNSAFTNNVARAGFHGSSDFSGYAGSGGAIYGYGRLVINNSTFSGNVARGGTAASSGRANSGADGGAIYFSGTATISSSTFTNNTAEGGLTNANASPSYGSYGGQGGALYLYGGTVNVSASTFSGNTAAGGGTGAAGAMGGSNGSGGAIYNYAGTTIANSSFTGNTAGAGADGSGSNYGYGGYGGAVYNTDSLMLDSTTLSSNTAAADTSTHSGGTGGGLYGSSSETVIRSTIVGNQAPGGNGNGGGIEFNGNFSQLTQSTLSGNTSYDGGGLYVNAPTSLTNDTIAANTATNHGGGIYNYGPSSLENVTVSGNSAQRTSGSGGGNLYLGYYTLTAHNTLIAGGTAPVSGGNCAFSGTNGILKSNGYNAEDSNQCNLSGPGDLINASLALGPLGNNGGPTQTIALMLGSRAIDAGDPAGCIDTDGNPLGVDQRGLPRPSGSRCDIGAFEYQYPPPSPPPPSPAPVAPHDGVLLLSPSSFAAQSHGGSIARAHQGTTVSYTDTRAAQTKFTVLAMVRGYHVGRGTCKARPKHGKLPKHAKGCTLTVAAGGFGHQDVAGANQFHFTGRVNGKALRKGSYELTATPVMGSLIGTTQLASFKIV